MNSPLYFNVNYTPEFRQQHPEMIYILQNKESDNLGIPLPSGIVRFMKMTMTAICSLSAKIRFPMWPKGKKCVSIWAVILIFSSTEKLKSYQAFRKQNSGSR